MAAPLILARTFKDAHAFAKDTLELAHGYYRVVNSPGTIKAVRNTDIYLVPGWKKRPDRFSMQSALKWCRLNVIDVEAQQAEPASDPAADFFTTSGAMSPEPVEMPTVEGPAVADEERISQGTIFAEPIDIGTGDGIVANTISAEKIGGSISADRILPGLLPEGSTMFEAPGDEALHLADGEVLEDATTTEPEEPAEPPKRRRRTRCKDCGNLHFKEEACPPSEDA